ncbi:MAG TPA: hypothetical protein VN802_13010 [Stellaceae bacterium]|nr:hypothetical protein [Stellaceae bacterium]
MPLHARTCALRLARFARRSGKIMRRILRKIAANEHDQLGDITTLADPAVVTELVDNRMNRA